MIADLIRQFTDEVNGYREYMKSAESNPEYSAMYEQMAQAERGHASMLKQAIDDECAKHHDPEQAQECLKQILGEVRRMTDEQLEAIGG